MDAARLFGIALGLAVVAMVGWWLLARRRRQMPPTAWLTTAAASRAPRPTSLPALSPRFGGYAIEREIGRGAAGVVYLARDAEGRAVALKVVPLHEEDDADAPARERFLREAEMARRLRHPDIVAVLDAGEHRDSGWLAMEFVRGRDLGRYTQPSRLLPLPLVLTIGARIARALAHAHSRGVVHRDIKPANVIVDLASDTVKVADFGVAHVVDAERSRSGMVLGTPSYMAPEQLAGRQVDGRADLYALGVVLFQLLAGRLPHEAGSIGSLLQAIANERAPDLRTLRPELPEALAHVVALALEKRPEVRYADGTQLAADLDAVAAALEQPDAPEVTAPHRPPTGREGE
jgi:serine/threonine protein kinase